MTHYLPAGETYYALCGAPTSKANHRTEPDCPACRARLADQDADDLVIADALGYELRDGVLVPKAIDVTPRRNP